MARGKRYAPTSVHLAFSYDVLGCVSVDDNLQRMDQPAFQPDPIALAFLRVRSFFANDICTLTVCPIRIVVTKG